MSDHQPSSHRRPEMQPQSPGTLGMQDAASPRDSRVPRFTPGTVGVNDRSASSGPSAEETIVIERMNDGWDVLEASRKKMVEQLREVMQKGEGDESLNAEIATARAEHDKLAMAYFAILKDYLRNHYDPQANWGAHVRIGWLLRSRAVLQGIGDNSDDSELVEAVSELGVLQCRLAFDHYTQTQDEASFFYFVTFAGELQAQGDRHIDKLPAALQAMLQKMADETKPPTVEKAYQAWLKSLVTGIKPGDPLSVREMAKAARKQRAPDPVREMFERSQQMEGKH